MDIKGDWAVLPCTAWATVVGAGSCVVQQLFAGMLQPGAAHGICSCHTSGSGSVCGTTGDTSVHPPRGGSATLSWTSAWWRLRVPLGLGHL